ncbi:MAG TPA: glycosyltransferase family 2 protein [Longimicrobiaceae bacterium]|nr:glycosyltransferase family 2 protein [Longimicrobiaceae bacterium]
MDQALLALGVATLAFALAVAAELWWGHRSVARLHRVPPLPDDELPALSVIVPARDEERNLEQALRSVLAQAGPRVEVIAVDDRSTDATGAILERMAAAEPRLRVVHVRELPPGWLGKTHALDLGAGHAAGELLLFTDADVVMAPDTLRRAAAYFVRERLDHLTLGPRLELPGWLLQLFCTVFGVMFALFARPWKARDPRSSSHVGIGAFNLLRAEVYRAIGTHRAIALRPDDDMKLGKLVKKHGFRSAFADAAELLSVEWYRTLGELVRGLRKNGFAGVDYRLSLVVLGTVGQLTMFFWPFVAVFVTAGATRLAYLGAVAVYLALYAGLARQQRTPAWLGVFWPVATLLFLFVVWNATLYALVRRRIEWRGTHYPLDELRANRV